MSRRQTVILFCLALITSLLFNLSNLAYIRSHNPGNERLNFRSVSSGYTVWSIDNDWYLPYATNMEAGHGFTSDPSEPEMRVRRTPGYPLFYALFYFVFGNNAHLWIFIIQHLLFALSAVLLAATVWILSHDRVWALGAGLLFAVYPFIFSFAAFTLTESISPACVILTLYLLTRAHRSGNKTMFLLAGMIAALTFLVRPTAGVILLGCAGFVLFNAGSLRSVLQRGFMMGAGVLLLLLPWVIRNYRVSGEWIIAEKYYHDSPMKYGKAHTEFRFLISAWINPAELSAEEFSNSLLNSLVEGDSIAVAKTIEQHVMQWPDHAFRGFDRAELKDALHALANSYTSRIHYLKLNPQASRTSYLNLPEERGAALRFELLRMKFKRADPLGYYFITPLKTLFGVVFNSAVHHVAMLEPGDGERNIFQVAAKAALYVLNIALFLSLFPFMILAKGIRGIRVLCVAPVLVLALFLCFGLFRYVESRYLLPVYPLLILTLTYVLTRIPGVRKFS